MGCWVVGLLGSILQAVVSARLVPTKTTSTAAYAAVAPRTWSGLRSVPNVIPIAKRSIATHVVTRLDTIPGTLAMTSTGMMSDRPPADAMPNLNAKFLNLLALFATDRGIPGSTGWSRSRAIGRLPDGRT